MSVKRLNRKEFLRSVGLAGGAAAWLRPVRPLRSPRRRPRLPSRRSGPARSHGYAGSRRQCHGHGPVADAKATEAAIAKAAREAEDAKVLDLSQEQYLAKAGEDNKRPKRRAG